MAIIFGKEYTKKQLLDRMGNLGVAAGIRTIEYQDGYARGLRAYEIINGPLRFTVYIDKCLDIGELYYNGMPMHYHARPGIMNGNWFYEGENSAKSIMCGMMFTCGLSNVGPAQNMENGRSQPQHGLIRSTPAELFGARGYWQGDDYYMEVSGTMRESGLFDTNLVLRRTITTKLGDTAIYIHDEIENESSQNDVPFMIMYHCNLGFPFLDSCSRLIIDPLESSERDEVSRLGSQSESPFVFGPPEAQYAEQVFYHRLSPDENHMCQATMVNPERRLAFSIFYSDRELPNLIHWKCKDSGNYVTGIEPSNCYPEGLKKQEERGSLRRLSAHELISNELCLRLCSGDEADLFLK